ncbi:molybdopterin cofactor-binding domain-containing protein [uncultured Roseobacter sp.]|uniref:molybdopterin cofactor-binding domain-containing protein n=1 Tax=uncultured Roseobacter sp. TaxID=114847 RepID=UPI002615D4F0|nr:molybdopterin cofactor-binding domain-containing protein [uncultured Roseobacter sp.]
MEIELLKATDIDRRHFLKAAGGAGLALSFTLLPACGSAESDDDTADSARVNAFLAITPDNDVEVYIAQAEMGQGITTGLTQILAEELGSDWDRTRFRFSTERRKEFLSPDLYGGIVLTGASASTQTFFLPMRQAGAAARAMLIAAAAEQSSIPEAEFTTNQSMVIHEPTGDAWTFAELSQKAMLQPVPKNPPLKARSEFTLIGQSRPRLDLATKLDGSAKYGIDHIVPEMLWAAVRHGPLGRASISSFSSSKATGMPGVRKVVAVPHGIAVVADHYWQAVKALETVEVEFEPVEASNFSTDDMRLALAAGLTADGIDVPGAKGDADARLETASDVIEATYEMPMAAHGCIEPVTCTAFVQGEACKLWLSTQSPTLDAGYAANVLGVDPSAIEIHNEFMGGAFGRRTGREHIEEAILLSQAAQAPVKVIWSREEDILMDQFRTGAMMHGRLGLDEDGRPVAYSVEVSATGFWQNMLPDWYDRVKPLDIPAIGMLDSDYGIEHKKGRYIPYLSPPRIGPWRGNMVNHNLLPIESLIDEAAHHHGLDPLEYRMSLITDERSRAVIERAAELSGWEAGKTNSTRGIAFMHDERWRSRVAVIVELQEQDDRQHVATLYCVCDSGLVINPLLAKQNLEGGLLFGFSWALQEELTFTDGFPDQRNFGGYDMLRMDNAPRLVVEIIESSEEPGAFGEVATPVVAPALGNALFAATGQRFRRIPFAKHGAPL